MSTPLPPRQFGYWSGHFVVVSCMVGAGILTMSGFTLRDTGNPGALLALWAVGGLMALCGALTIAELAAALPRAGGDYVFVREGFGPGTGFVAGWATFVVGFAGPTAVIAHTALTYLTTPYADRLAGSTAYLVPLGASFLIAAVTAMHCLGQRESGRFQGTLTVLKLLVLSGLALGGLAFGRGDWGHFAAAAWPTDDQWPALATGLIYVGYAYSGWNGAAYLAGEIRDPARLLPRAMVGGTLSVVALYLLVNVLYGYALDPVAMMTRKADEVQPVARLAVTELFGPQAADVFATLIGLGLTAAVSAYLLAGPRVTFAMARDGFFPAFAGRLHPTRGIPVWATLAQGAAAVAVVWSGSFRELLDYTSAGLAAVSGLVVASVFPLRRRADVERPYRLPLYPLPPLLYLGLVGWTVVHQLMQADRRLPTALGLLTLAAGVPLGWVVRRRSAARVTSPPEPPASPS